MEIHVSKIYVINTIKERERINKVFSGAVKKRQLKLLDAFENRDWKLFEELYDSLPYNKKDECHEQEYVGLEIQKFLDDVNFNGLTIKPLV